MLKKEGKRGGRSGLGSIFLIKKTSEENKNKKKTRVLLIRSQWYSRKCNSRLFFSCTVGLNFKIPCRCCPSKI